MLIRSRRLPAAPDRDADPTLAPVRVPVPAPSLPKSAMALADLGTEALAGLLQRPVRSALTMLGTILGIGSFVAVLGLTATATGQIGHQFSILEDTTVTITDTGAQNRQATGSDNAIDFPPDADARIQALNGATAAGTWWTVPVHDPQITATPDPVGNGAPAQGSALPLYAASPGLFAAADATLQSGVEFNTFHNARGERVAVLGAAAARQLGISNLAGQPAVFVNGRAFTVVGIIGDTQSLPQLLLGVILPANTAQTLYGPPDPATPAQMLIKTGLGAAPLIARQAPLDLRPDDPALLQATAPPDPRGLRDSVDTDLGSLFLILAAICLVVGAVGIATTTLVSVMERTGEIGLRRSIGARPRHIAAQFLLESTALGLLGGLIGTALGVLAVTGTALDKHWTAVLQPLAVLPAPVIGAAVGLVAGLYPAARSARIQPLEALRQ